MSGISDCKYWNIPTSCKEHGDNALESILGNWFLIVDTLRTHRGNSKSLTEENYKYLNPIIIPSSFQKVIFFIKSLLTTCIDKQKRFLASYCREKGDECVYKC